VATTITRTYLERATLLVNLELEGAGQNSNALWRIDGGLWHTSGTTVSNLNPGAHVLEFSTVTGWTTPPVETVVLTPGQYLPITRVYGVMRGAVRTVLLPLNAITGGAQWRIDNGTWINSGDTVIDLALTTHTIDFRSIPMWTTPASLSVNVTNEQTIVVTGSYVQVSGLYVTIEPATAISEGAFWRLNGGEWTNSGTFIELPPGTYNVSFSPVNGWVPPDAVSAIVVSQTVTTVVGSYYRMDVFGGDPGSSPGQFVSPRSVAIDSHHNLYVSDSANNRIQKYDALSLTWTNMGTGGSGTGQFITPEGITVDAAANLFVADSGNNRIQKRTATNGQWRSWGTYGTNVGNFVSPMDVAVDSKGFVYVADRDRNRIQKLSTNGVTWSVFINSGSANGYVTAPKGLFVDSSDNVYVSDNGAQTNGDSRIQKFSKNGTFLALLGSKLPSQGQLKRPGGLTMGITNLYVADIDNSRVAASSTNASWSTIIGSNVLDHAEDVTWDPRGFLLIADTGNNRVLRLPIIPGVETNSAVPFSGVMNPGTGTNASFTISWFGILNWYYAVEYANTLLDPWSVLPGFSSIAGQNAWTNCVDNSIGGVTSRFYRVRAY
jgi:sugar lactone lactonase YvrE